MTPGVWVAREPPLPPAAVVALGAVAVALLDHVAAAVTDPAAPRWTGIWSPEGWLVLIGDDLPWADGVVYVGRDREAPGLLLPTRRRPGTPVDLVASALLRRFRPEQWPVVMLEAPAVLLPLGAARPLGPAECARARRALTAVAR